MSNNKPKERTLRDLDEIEEISGLGKITFISKKKISMKELEKIEEQLEELEQKLHEGKDIINKENEILLKKGNLIEKRLNKLKDNEERLYKLSYNKDLTINQLNKIEEMINQTNLEIVDLENKLEKINKTVSLGAEDRIKVGRNQPIGIVIEQLKDKLTQKEIITQTEKLSEEDKVVFEQTLRNWYSKLKEVRNKTDWEKGGIGRKKIWGGGVTKDINVGHLFCLLDTLRSINKDRYGELINIIKLVNKNDLKLQSDLQLAMKSCVLDDIYLCYEDKCFIAKPKITMTKQIIEGESIIGDDVFPIKEVIQKEAVIMKPKGTKFAKKFKLSGNERATAERNKLLMPVESVKEYTELLEGYVILVPIKYDYKTKEDFIDNFKKVKDDIDYELEKPVNLEFISTMKVGGLKSPITGEKLEFSYDKIRKEISLLTEINEQLDFQLKSTINLERRKQVEGQIKRNNKAIVRFIRFIGKWRNFLKQENIDIEKEEMLGIFKEEEAYNIPTGTIYKYIGEKMVATTPEEPEFYKVKKVIGFEDDIPKGWKVKEIVVTGRKVREEELGVELTLPFETKKLLSELKGKLKVRPLHKRIEGFKRLVTIRNERLNKLKELRNKIISGDILIEDLNEKENLILLNLEIGELKGIFDYDLFLLGLREKINDLTVNIKYIRKGIRTGRLYEVPAKYTQMSKDELELVYPFKLTRKKIREFSTDFHFKVINMFKAPIEYNVEEGFTYAIINKEDVEEIEEYEKKILNKLKNQLIVLNRELDELNYKKKKARTLKTKRRYTIGINKLEEIINNLDKKVENFNISLEEFEKFKRSKAEDFAIKVLTNKITFHIGKMLRELKLDKKGVDNERFKLIIENIIESGNYYKIDFIGNDVVIYRKPELISPFRPITDGELMITDGYEEFVGIVQKYYKMKGNSSGK